MEHTATYSPEDNKLRLYPACRLDAELYKRVKAAGFAWAPKQECFYAVWAPGRADLLTELCGEIGDEDKSLMERAEDRAERFTEYRESRTADAEAAHSQVEQISERFAGGQPILVGHHSERKARKDAERIENGMRKALKMWETADYWKSRAAGAIRHAKYKERPDVRARRIKTIEAEIRSYRARFTPSSKQVIIQSKWDAPSDAPKVPHVWCAPRGGRGGSWVAVESLPGLEKYYSRWIQHCEMRLEYERAMLEDAGGTVADRTGPEVGGGCKCWASPRGGWAYIRKVNKVTVSIDDNWGNGGGNFTRTIPFDKLTSIMSRAEVEAKRQAGLLLDREDGTGYHLRETPGDGTKDETPDERNARLHREAVKPETEQKILDLKSALKSGIQVVTAPQLFPTPVSLAERMVTLADLTPGISILEPSAGTGRIMAAIVRSVLSPTITAIEVSQSLASALAAHYPDSGIRVHCKDFLTCNGDLGKFERVIMNPPFVAGADITHITHALKFLKPGGRLVAICANGPRQQKTLMPLADTWEPLPAGTFSESGTGVNTVLLTITKGNDNA